MCSFADIKVIKFYHGVVIWKKNDSGGAAEEEPEGAEQGDEGAGQGARQDGAAGEEDHRRHQEDGQAGSDGRCQDHGKGSSLKY